MVEVEKIHNEISNTCPECGGDAINDQQRGEIICQQCGLVVDEILEETSFLFENSNNENNLNKQYVALGERTDFVGGLGSFIDFEKSKFFKDKNGSLLAPDEQKLFRRLKKNYAQFLRIKNHETEYRIFNILNKISLYLNLNKNIRNNAAYYYKKILKNEEKVINNISLIAFCIFYAAREEYHNAPITINEIADSFQKYGHRVSPRLILRDGIRYKRHIKKDATPHKSEDYIVRLLDQVINHKDLEERIKVKGVNWSKKEYHEKLTKKCREIFKKMDIMKRGGRNQFIFTGAVIYLADRLLAKEFSQKAILTQKMLSKATNIAEYSIRDHYVNCLKPCFLKN